MCMLCVEVQKQNMTVRELVSAYREFEFKDGHELDVHTAIMENYDLSEVIDELNKQLIPNVFKEIL